MVRAVWELTWRCNLRCTHCLVEAGPARDDELSTEEAFQLVDQLAELGTQAVTLTGGEPLFRKDWDPIAQRIVDRGMALMLSCNGHLLRPATVQRLQQLDCKRVILSLDGLRATHDAIRRFPETRAARSSWEEVTGAIHRLKQTDIAVEVITAVRAGNLDELPQLHEAVKALGIDIWSVQLAHPTGRFSGHTHDMVDRARMPELAEFLARASRDPVLAPMVHPSIGWLSKEEPLLRSSARGPTTRVWRGSGCGKRVVAIEPNGGVKGCPNQVGDPFIVGNIRTEALVDIWNDRTRWHWLPPNLPEPSGACADCVLAPVCGGGCPCVAVATTGRVFDNPWCVRAIRRAQA